MSGAATAIAVGAGASAAGATIGTAIIAGAAAGSMVNSYQQGKEQIKTQKETAAAQEKRAVALENKQTEAFNAANRKQADIGDLLTRNAGAAAGGAGSTLLTGMQGVPNNQLSLARNNLLGA